MKQALTGILPVAPTPFFDDGRVDENGMRRVLDCMIDQGVDAICILANYSEQFLLSDEERAILTRISLEHVVVTGTSLNPSCVRGLGDCVLKHTFVRLDKSLVRRYRQGATW